MIIYTVYQSDWECPQIIFHTLIKEKAGLFCTEANRNHIDEMGKMFVSTIDTDKIESLADEIIAGYGLKKIVDIEINKYEQTIISETIKYVNKTEDDEYAKILDYCADTNTWDKALVTLIVPADNFNLEDPNIQERIKNLLYEEEQLLYELYKD